MLRRLAVVEPVRVHQGSLASARKRVTMELDSTIRSIFRRKARGSLGLEFNDLFSFWSSVLGQDAEERASCGRLMIRIGVA